MRIDLVENSEQYEAFSYPGGERQVRLMGDTVAKVKGLRAVHGEIDLVARIRSPQDIIDTLLLTDAIQGVDPGVAINLHLPYLPYGRADRRFTDGDCAGEWVFSNMIETGGFETITTLDAHSGRSSFKTLNRFIDLSPEEYIRKSIIHFASTYSENGDIDILFPDEGAKNRYTGILRQDYGYNHKNVFVKRFLYAAKKRDLVTGNLSGFEAPPLERPTLIVDDLCDGGGTFVGIAKMANRDHPLGLYVTHGIFSQGLARLLEEFVHLYYTDSFKTQPWDVNTPVVTQYKLKFDYEKRKDA